MTKPKLFMMVGIPASGKSKEAIYLSVAHNAVIHSSDKLREELSGDMNNQDINQEVFKELHKRIKKDLQQNKNVIMDCTNINYKRRKAFLDTLKNIDCEKIAVIMATPYDICLKRNEERERNISPDIIKRMYMNFTIPYWYEGWDDIRITYDSEERKSIETSLLNYALYNQDNVHHTRTLGMHCLFTGNMLKEHNETLTNAGYLHDIGKPFVKSFLDSKGEEDTNSHYYNHENVGAYESLFYDLGQADPLNIAVLIQWHMQPYFWKDAKKKTIKKYKELWGEELYNNIMLLHKEDEEMR